jgi:hypothetical protein
MNPNSYLIFSDMISRTFYRTSLLIIISAVMVSCEPPVSNSIQLAGEWDLCLDSTNVKDIDQLTFNLNINLPGNTG